MEIRIRATEPECLQAVDALRTAFDIRSVSRFYPDRGVTVLGRTFVDAVPLPTVGRLLTAASPEPPSGTIVRGLGAERWERHPDGGSCSWFRIDDEGRPFGDPESWTKVAGNYGPVSVEKLGKD